MKKKIFSALKAAEFLNVRYGFIRGAIELNLLRAECNGPNYAILYDDLVGFAVRLGIRVPGEDRGGDA